MNIQNNLSVSINQLELHSKAYNVARTCTYRQRLALCIGAKQNQRDAHYMAVTSIIINTLPLNR